MVIAISKSRHEKARQSTCNACGIVGAKRPLKAQPVRAIASAPISMSSLSDDRSTDEAKNEISPPRRRRSQSMKSLGISGIWP
jgi:hypothetical protein